MDSVNGIHDPIYLIREQSLVLGADLALDSTSPYVALGGVVPSGTEIQSWILHFDMEGVAQVNGTAAGVYDFGLPILGLIYTESGLDGTDLLLGNPATTYPTGVYYRDSDDSSGPPDMWSIINPTTLFIEGLQNQGVGFDQIRVITATTEPDPGPHPAPEPTSLVIWAMICGGMGFSSWRMRRVSTAR